MKMVVFRRRWLMVAGCAAAAIAMFGVVSNPAAVGAAATERALPIYYVQDNGEKRAALTFDAAWGNEDTEELIEILGRYDVKATFFLVGQWVDKYPESVKALSDAGHEIENHSSTHPHLPQCSSEQIRQELEDCNRKIEAITGTAPKFHRCPYGDYDNNAMIMFSLNPAFDMLPPSDPLAWSPSSGTWTAWTGRSSPHRRSPSG